MYFVFYKTGYEACDVKHIKTIEVSLGQYNKKLLRMTLSLNVMLSYKPPLKFT